MKTDLAHYFNLHRKWAVAGLLALIVCAGAFLRLDGLDAKTLTHPEAYVPGITLPDGISTPPPRLTLYSLLYFHFHDEPHPQGYYALMWVWTKMFGTSLKALRLPSVLFGVGSIILIFWVAAITYDLWTGLLAAALLAFNGHHIYWSQMARMYSMLCLLALLSTLLWLQLMRQSKPDPLREILYVVVSLIGVFTEIFFWPFLAAQILWTVIHQRSPGKTSSRMASIQTLIIILGSPMWAHAIYRSRQSPLDNPSLTFLQEFINFGFLFERDFNSDPYRSIHLIGATLLTLITVLCISRSLSIGGRKFTTTSARAGLKVAPLLLAAAGAVLTILVFAILAHRRQLKMALTALIPMMAVMLPFTLSRVRALLMTKIGTAAERLTSLPGVRSPLFFLAVVPASIVIAVSFYNSLAGSRQFLLFNPYVLVLIAVGIKTLCVRPLINISLAIILVTSHVFSVTYYRAYPSEVLDYQGLAQKMASKINEGDLIFVHKKSWVTTPIFYYLKPEKYQLIAENYLEEAQRHPHSRVWVIEFVGEPISKEMHAALANYHRQDQVESLRSVGLSYVR